MGRPARQRDLVSKVWTPEPGDLIKLDLDPRVGHEEAGWRPAIVISESSYNRRVGLCLVCPITNQAKGYPFEVPLPQGLAVQGVILSDHVKSVHFKARRARQVGAATRDVLDTVRAYVALVIGAK